MKSLTPAAALLLLLTACQVAGAPQPQASGSPRTAEASEKRVSQPVASASPPNGSKSPPAALSSTAARRLPGLLDALRDAQTTRELSRANNLISDRGGGLVSKIRTGIVSNNGATVISNHGGSVVGQNGAGVVGQNGAGVVGQNGAGVVGQNGAGLASETAGGYRLAQVTTPEATPTPPIYKVIPHEDPPYSFFTTFYLPMFAGNIVGYDKADYTARGTAATEVERYEWDDVPFESLPRDAGVEFDKVRAHFGVRVVRSRRLTFTTQIDIDFELYIKQPMPKLLTAFKSMQATFVMAVPDDAGGSSELSVRARDYVYPPGAGPGETPDGIYPMPIAFSGDGANARGTLTVKVTSPEAGDVGSVVSSTFTRTAGGSVASTVTSYIDGRRDEQVDDAASGLRLALRFAADGAGEGDVQPTAGGAPVGTLRWDATGRGSITLDGEPSAPITLR